MDRLIYEVIVHEPFSNFKGKWNIYFMNIMNTSAGEWCLRFSAGKT